MVERWDKASQNIFNLVRRRAKLNLNLFSFGLFQTDLTKCWSPSSNLPDSIYFFPLTKLFKASFQFTSGFLFQYWTSGGTFAFPAYIFLMMLQSSGISTRLPKRCRWKRASRYCASLVCLNFSIDSMKLSPKPLSLFSTSSQCVLDKLASLPQIGDPSWRDSLR